MTAPAGASAPPTLAQAINAVVAELIPLLNALSAKSDLQSASDAASLNRVIGTLLTDAMQANALDVESKLAQDATGLTRLRAFTTQADQEAKTLAQQQQNVTKFVSLANHIGQVVVAGAGGNVAGVVTGLTSACSDLGIAVP